MKAEMTLTQVENGLSLSKMVLCQLCGLPLDSEIRLADEQMENLSLPNVYTESNVNTALANRKNCAAWNWLHRSTGKRSM